MKNVDEFFAPDKNRPSWRQNLLQFLKYDEAASVWLLEA